MGLRYFLIWCGIGIFIDLVYMLFKWDKSRKQINALAEEFDDDPWPESQFMLFTVIISLVTSPIWPISLLLNFFPQLLPEWIQSLMKMAEEKAKRQD